MAVPRGFLIKGCLSLPSCLLIRFSPSEKWGDLPPRPQVGGVTSPTPSWGEKPARTGAGGLCKACWPLWPGRWEPPAGRRGGGWEGFAVDGGLGASGGRHPWGRERATSPAPASPSDPEAAWLCSTAPSRRRGRLCVPVWPSHPIRLPQEAVRAWARRLPAARRFPMRLVAQSCSQQPPSSWGTNPLPGGPGGGPLQPRFRDRREEGSAVIKGARRRQAEAAVMAPPSSR